MISSSNSLRESLTILLEHLSDSQYLQMAWKIEPGNHRSFSESRSCFLELCSQIFELEEENIFVVGKQELALLKDLYDDVYDFPIRGEEILDVHLLLANPEWIKLQEKCRNLLQAIQSEEKK